MAEKPITLTNREIVNLREGLSALDGVVDKAGTTTEVTRFEFDDKLSWNIAKNLDIAERAALVYEKAKKSKAAKLGIVQGQKVTDANAPAIAALLEYDNALLDQTQTLNGILRLSRADIQKGGKIPPSVLKNLMPILNDA